MADNATQYAIPLKEVAELIIKKEGIHEGYWAPSVGLQIGMGAFGATPDQQFPGAAVSVVNIGIQRIEDTNSAAIKGPLSIDAAAVNPKPSEKKPDKKKAT